MVYSVWQNSLLPPGKPEIGKNPDHVSHANDLFLHDLQFLTNTWLTKMPVFRENAKSYVFMY